MAAYQLLGETPYRMFHDQVFGKPANHGGLLFYLSFVFLTMCSAEIYFLTKVCGLASRFFVLDVDEAHAASHLLASN
jgi:hypothetical protein